MADGKKLPNFRTAGSNFVCQNISIYTEYRIGIQEKHMNNITVQNRETNQQIFKKEKHLIQ